MDPLEKLSPLRRYWFTLGNLRKSDSFIRRPKPEDLSDDEWELLLAMCHLNLAKRAHVRSLNGRGVHLSTASSMLFFYGLSDFESSRETLNESGARGSAGGSYEDWKESVLSRPQGGASASWLQAKASAHLKLAIWHLEGLLTCENKEVRNRAEREYIFQCGKITRLGETKYEVELMHMLRTGS